MDNKSDIVTIEDIKNLVNSFYDKVRKDDLIGPVFNERIGNNWPKHLEKMYTFWETVLLEQYTYQGRPFPPHAQLPISKIHFERWIELFTSTVDSLFEGEKAQEAKLRAGKMALLFQSKLEYFREKGLDPLV